ncbi:MAG: S1 RNA-binding domain-containing protein [Pirellulaceae bacterium]|nr:S1 RNA-binding domain-containing protein [Pirellulaceae bacterium]
MSGKNFGSCVHFISRDLKFDKKQIGYVVDALQQGCNLFSLLGGVPVVNQSSSRPALEHPDGDTSSEAIPDSSSNKTGKESDTLSGEGGFTVEVKSGGATVTTATAADCKVGGGIETLRLKPCDLLEIQRKYRSWESLQARKQAVIKTITSQGKLTAELQREIENTLSEKRLEDIFLPFKQRRKRACSPEVHAHLSPALEKVLALKEEEGGENSLDSIFGEAVSEELGLSTKAIVEQKITELLVEHFYLDAELRGKLRRLLRPSAKLVSKKEVDARSVAPLQAETTQSDKSQSEIPSISSETGASKAAVSKAGELQETVATQEKSEGQEQEKEPTASEGTTVENTAAENTTVENTTTEFVATGTTAATENTTDQSIEPQSVEPTAEVAAEEGSAERPPSQVVSSDEVGGGAAKTTEVDSVSAEVPTMPETKTEEVTTVEAETTKPPQRRTEKLSPKEEARQKRREIRKEVKRKKREKAEHTYRRYFDFQSPVSRISSQALLVLMQGERGRQLKIDVQLRDDLARETAERALELEKNGAMPLVRNALERSLSEQILPALARELKNDLFHKTDQYVGKQVRQALRALLMQPPQKVSSLLAIYPAAQYPAHAVVLGGDGSLLHRFSFKAQKGGRKAKEQLADVLAHFPISVVAVANMPGCRDVENLLTQLFTSERLKKKELSYTLVNTLGDIEYARTPEAKAEFSDRQANYRKVAFLGRKFLDPLNAYLKVPVHSLCVGHLQQELKGKQRQPLIQEELELLVSEIGVDLNKAHERLLTCVAGLDIVSARTILETRDSLGGAFATREELAQKTGLDESALTQALSFLKIYQGDQLLDATTLHPRDYRLAQGILAKCQMTMADLLVRSDRPFAVLAEPSSEVQETAETTTGEETIDSKSTKSVAADVTADGPALDVATAAENSQGETSEEPTVSAEVAAVTEVTEGAKGPAKGGEARAKAPLPHWSEKNEPSWEICQTKQKLLVEKLDIFLDLEALAAELGVSLEKLRSIIRVLKNPLVDPRDKVSGPALHKRLLTLDELEIGQKLIGTVFNIADFGVFVDIGAQDSALVHISRLSNEYVKTPDEVVNIGDTLTVWVTKIEKEKSRISLTAVEPGTEATSPRKGSGGRPSRHRSKPAGGGKNAGASGGNTEGNNRSGQGRRGSRSQGEQSQGQPAFRKKGANKPHLHGGGNKSFSTRKKPAKPAPPISKAMRDGKEPLRSFADLQQFLTTEDESSSDEKKE